MFYSDSIKIVDYLDGFQTEERDSRIPKKRRSHKKKNNEQTHTATLASFDLEILNFQSLTRPFVMEHKVYVNPGALDFKTNTDSGNGTKITNVLKTDYLFKFQNQERQDELGLNWDSFKWRNYDYAIGRFFNIDPLADKYSYNSPYAFQENKMGMGVELEGLELVHSDGNSPEFRQKFAQTVKFMNEKGTSGKMAKLNQQSKTTIIDNTGNGSFYRPEENAIYWDPTQGLETTNGHLLSPATVLDHEIDHALQHKLYPEQFQKDRNTFNENYDTLEEKRVITTSEQETALKHGEIEKGEITREDHSGQGMVMPNPTSTIDASYSETIELEPTTILGK